MQLEASRASDDPGQPFSLSRLLNDTYADDLEALKQAYVIEVDFKDLEKYKEDGCLFFKFVSRGITAMRVKQGGGPNMRMFAEFLKLGNQQDIEQADSVVIRITLCEGVVSFGIVVKRWFRPIHSCNFGMFASEKSDSVYTNFPLTPIVHPDSVESMNRSKIWLEDCIKNHSQCVPKIKDFCPHRLIKISKRQGRRLLRLEESCKPNTPYAALSYCWGGEQLVRTTKGNLLRHLTVINFHDLPPTIRDAVIVADQLGLEYLWVDALCIVQDDEFDRAQEIGMMGCVYESATMTIVASRAAAVSEGFLQHFTPYGRENPERVFMMRFHSRFSEYSKQVILAPRNYQKSPDHVSKRAWAYQERLFSSRLIEYRADCVNWYCRETMKCDRNDPECARASVKNTSVIAPQDLRDHEPRVATGSWYAAVEGYSARLLTLPSDRLPGIAGIAERYHEYDGLLFDDYLAGIWQSTLPGALLWRARRYEVARAESKVRNNLAPTWSWASVNGPVEYPYHTSNSRAIVKAQVLDVKLQYLTLGAKYGATISGHLRLSGFVKPVDWDPKHEKMSMTGSCSWLKDLPIVQDLDFCVRHAITHDDSRRRVYLLVVSIDHGKTHALGLILHRNTDGLYSRLGSFEIHSQKSSGVGNFEFPKRTVDNDHKAITLLDSLLEGEPQEVTIK